MGVNLVALAQQGRPAVRQGETHHIAAGEGPSSDHGSTSREEVLRPSRYSEVGGLLCPFRTQTLAIARNVVAACCWVVVHENRAIERSLRFSCSCSGAGDGKRLAGLYDLRAAVAVAGRK